MAGPATVAERFRRCPEAGPLAVTAERRDAGEQTRPWYAEAYRLKGLKEAAGAANNATADSVSVARIAKTRLLGARWPTSVPQAGAVTPIRDAGAEISTDEA